MIVGNGQLARIFKNDAELPNDVVIFASGVSNSNCTDPNEFVKEEELLQKISEELNGKSIVYFSSCALSDIKYLDIPYYAHKLHMESIIKKQTGKFYIFRLPQVFGKLKEHPTLINFIYFSILYGREFKLYVNSYRYVIDIDDVLTLVTNIVSNVTPGLVINLANSYKYGLPEIVREIEFILNKKAKTIFVDKNDSYNINLSDLNEIVLKLNLNLNFGRDYLTERLQKRHGDFNII